MIGNELALVFGDGFEAYLPLDLLRRCCPCAICQGEPDVMGRVIKSHVSHGPGAWQLNKWEVVGGYALQFTWGDGHASGIYSYSYLQKLSQLPNL